MFSVSATTIRRRKCALATFLVLAALATYAPQSRAETKLTHTYQTGFATEVAHTIPVSAAKLTPLLPDDYVLVPAAVLGLGGWDEGLVVIFNFYGTDNSIDRRRSRNRSSTRIDLLILVTEPAAARSIGASIPGAFHFYSLSFYTNDAEFAASLRLADMPVEFVPQITHERDMNASGEGTLAVSAPSRCSPFYSDSTAFGHLPAGPLNGFFWYEGKKGTAVLNFQIDVTEQGQAQSLIFTEPGSPLNRLLDGGGFGPGPTDPATGFESVITPSLNLFYPQGSRGQLLLIED